MPIRTQTSSANKLDVDRGKKIYNYFVAHYPLYRKDCSQNKAVAAGELAKWIAVAAVLSDNLIRCALTWCRDHETYAPSVARFKFKAHGLVDTDIAFEVATYDHECWAVRQAYNSLSRHDWNYQTEGYQRKKFIAAYRELCENLVDGKMKPTEEIRLIQPEEVAKISKPLTEEEKKEQSSNAEAALEKVKELLAQAGANKLKRFGTT